MNHIYERFDYLHDFHKRNIQSTMAHYKRSVSQVYLNIADSYKSGQSAAKQSIRTR